MHWDGVDRGKRYIPKYKSAKFVRKVKLKCVKLKKRPYYRNGSSQQMSTEQHINRRSYISNNNGRKIKGNCT